MAGSGVVHPAPGTDVVRMVSNTATPYLFSTVSLERDVVDLDSWRIAVGLVPAGRVHVRLPLSDLTQVQVTASARPDRFVAAAVLALAGTAAGRWPAVQLGLRILAVALVLLGVIAVVRFSTADRHVDVPICLRELGRARALSALLDERLRETGRAAARPDQSTPT